MVADHGRRDELPVHDVPRWRNHAVLFDANVVLPSRSPQWGHGYSGADMSTTVEHVVGGAADIDVSLSSPDITVDVGEAADIDWGVFKGLYDTNALTARTIELTQYVMNEGSGRHNIGTITPMTGAKWIIVAMVDVGLWSGPHDQYWDDVLQDRLYDHYHSWFGHAGITLNISLLVDNNGIGPFTFGYDTPSGTTSTNVVYILSGTGFGNIVEDVASRYSDHSIGSVPDPPEWDSGALSGYGIVWRISTAGNLTGQDYQELLEWYGSGDDFLNIITPNETGLDNMKGENLWNSGSTTAGDIINFYFTDSLDESTQGAGGTEELTFDVDIDHADSIEVTIE